MRRRQPDSIDVQQMKAHEREERIRREVSVHRYKVLCGLHRGNPIVHDFLDRTRTIIARTV